LKDKTQFRSHRIEGCSGEVETNEADIAEMISDLADAINTITEFLKIGTGNVNVLTQTLDLYDKVSSLKS
jgi:hypothetical protein